MKSTQLTVTDQFCGCGGSSQGVRKASLKYGGGIEVRLAMNHWKLAVETHNTNFPDADHDCANVQATDPRRYQSTDILITSPECTNHSLAKGVKRKYQQTRNLFGDITVDETAVRSRATMWDVPRFAEVHRYNTPNGLFCVDCWKNKVTKQFKKDCERKALRRLQSLSGGFVSGVIEQIDKKKQS